MIDILHLFFFKHPATTETYTSCHPLPLHDALPSCATTSELLDPALASNDLLYRLFHEDGVRVTAPQPLRARCRCSRERVETVLKSLPRDRKSTRLNSSH